MLLSALTYALTVLITRRLSTSDSSATMAYYSSLVYLVATIALAPLTITVGPIEAHPSIAFLFRVWVVPNLTERAVHPLP